jgi:hypothetical protein
MDVRSVFGTRLDMCTIDGQQAFNVIEAWKVTRVGVF